MAEGDFCGVQCRGSFQTFRAEGGFCNLQFELSQVLCTKCKKDTLPWPSLLLFFLARTVFQAFVVLCYSKTSVVMFRLMFEFATFATSTSH